MIDHGPVSRYDSFEKMLDAEGPENVNLSTPREVQFVETRRIYAPENEALVWHS